MSRSLFQFLVVLFVSGLLLMPARAVTDYNCVNSCVKDGKTASACLPQCTQDEPADHKPKGPTYTDYRCLNLCMKDGQSSALCLSKCSYGGGNRNAAKNDVLPALPGSRTTTVPTHKTLQAPIPAGDKIFLPSGPAAPLAPQKDYACIAQCVHDGIQYQLCNQSCHDVTPEYKKEQ